MERRVALAYQRRRSANDTRRGKRRRRSRNTVPCARQISRRIPATTSGVDENPPRTEACVRPGGYLESGATVSGILMQTNLADFIKNTPHGREADTILRNCVHCGFCLPTCPTYQLLGDELDGPRGRIYLIKQVLEGQTPTAKTQLHLDRCLTCRACETACPSGVQYGRLLDIGRELTEERVPRAPGQRLRRYLLRRV